MVLILSAGLVLLNCFLTKKRHDSVQKSLGKLEKKFEEVLSWKRLVQDLPEGIILIDKNFKILY